MTDQPTRAGRFSRRDFIRRSAGTVVIAGGLPAILAACTGAGEDTPSPAPSGSSGGGVTTGTLRVGWSSEPDTLNPLTSFSTEANEVLQLIYDKLNDYDADLNIQASLAESTTASADGKTVSYALRQGVTWHDGTPFTADDVVFTFSSIKDGGSSQYAQWLTDMTGISAVDAQTVEVTYKRPQAFDPGLAIPILPAHIWQDLTPAQIQKFPNDAPVGTGPFTFGSWEHGQTVQVERYDDFWGTPAGASTVIWVLYQNEDVMAQGLESNEVDILPEVPPTIWDGLSTGGDVKPLSLPSFSFHHIGINVSDQPTSGGNPLLLDRDVRQALSLAVDRNQLVQIALAGHGLPGSVLLPPAMGDFQLQIPEADQLNAKADQARQVLDQAGYAPGSDGIREKDDQRLEFRLIAIESTTVDVRAAQLFANAAEDVGIKLNLTTLDENTLGSTVYNIDAPDWDIFVWGWDSGVNDPNYLLGVPLTSQIGGNNDVFYSNPEYDALYDEQATELDIPARLDIVHQMQQIFYDDCAYIVMWYQDKLQAYRTDTFTGWTDTPGGVIFNLTRANYLNATPVA
jgi:peptide/nickel transport system substrate-binding protein